MSALGGAMRSLIPIVALVPVLTVNAAAQSLRVNGQAGVLGEWELSATATETIASGRKEFFGPVTLKHTGLCTKDGPQEKAGEIRFQLSRSATRIDATILLDGAACSFSAKKSDAFSGVLKCPEQEDLPLLVWVR
jgi:hypothetical protein